MDGGDSLATCSVFQTDTYIRLYPLIVNIQLTTFLKSSNFALSQRATSPACFSEPSPPPLLNLTGTAQKPEGAQPSPSLFPVAYAPQRAFPFPFPFRAFFICLTRP